MTRQLSLSERYIIERMIHNDYTFASIGRKLNRSASTISREVLHYRCFVNPLRLEGDNDCIYFLKCVRNWLCPDHGRHDCYGARCKACPDHVDCRSLCPSYESVHCPYLNKPPYVCSGCDLEHQKSCRKNHAYYSAHRANATHHKTISTAHSGIRRTSEELVRIGSIIEPLIRKGQSLSHICSTHGDELGVSEKTLYTYISNGAFKVRDMDLPKKVSYRKRRKQKVLTRFEYRYRQGRTYEDFKRYIEEYPDLPVVEMDTVKGRLRKENVLLTFIFRETSFMLIFLMSDGTQASVRRVFDSLTDRLGPDLFRSLFPIILTDNGVEFKCADELENTPNGFPRSHLFFCDPQASWQKPQIENSHRLIRRILPKGTSFMTLTMRDVHLITRHINSVRRDHLKGLSPFDLMTSKEQKKLLSSLDLSPIPPDEVILKPQLIKH